MRLVIGLLIGFMLGAVATETRNFVWPTESKSALETIARSDAATDHSDYGSSDSFDSYSFDVYVEDMLVCKDPITLPRSGKFKEAIVCPEDFDPKVLGTILHLQENGWQRLIGPIMKSEPTGTPI